MLCPKEYGQRVGWGHSSQHESKYDPKTGSQSLIMQQRVYAVSFKKKITVLAAGPVGAVTQWV